MSRQPTLEDQARHLIEVGALEGTDVSAPELLLRARELTLAREDALLVFNAAPSHLAQFMKREGHAGFVTTNMADADMFTPIDPDCPRESVYAIATPTRDDSLAGMSPEHAVQHFAAEAVAPLTLVEGINWVIQSPEVVKAGMGFMTPGSRMVKSDGHLDSRVPGIWVAGGTGKDEAGRKGALKVGWCWWRNVHSWLTFASTERRYASPAKPD